MAALEGRARGVVSRARLGTPDHEAIPGRDRRWIAVCRIARNRRDQAGEGHFAARAQKVRPGLRGRTRAPRTADGDDRALRARGAAARPGAARGSSGSTDSIRSARGEQRRIPRAESSRVSKGGTELTWGSLSGAAAAGERGGPPQLLVPPLPYDEAIHTDTGTSTGP